MKLWMVAAIGAAALLSGCVSTSMKTFVGRPIQDVQIEYGPPTQIIDMPDAARAYQFRTEGGAMIMPGSAVTHAYPAGGGFISTTTGTPGGAVNVPGCLLTFIARERSGVWIVEDIRVPKRLVC